MLRFYETLFLSNPDEFIEKLFIEKPELKIELQERRLKVAKIHYALQEKYKYVEELSKLIFDCLVSFFNVHNTEFKDLVENLHIQNNFFLKDKIPNHNIVKLSEIFFFESLIENVLIGDNSVKNGIKIFNKLLNKNNKQKLSNIEYSEFIDKNFILSFSDKINKLLYRARKVVMYGDSIKLKKFIEKISCIENICEQYIKKFNQFNIDILTYMTDYCHKNLSFFTIKNIFNVFSNSNIDYILTVKGKNFGSIYEIDKETKYKKGYYYKGITSIKTVNIKNYKDKIFKNNILFLESY